MSIRKKGRKKSRKKAVKRRRETTTISKRETAELLRFSHSNLAKAYAEQIDEIGEMLVKHCVISRLDLERNGVRFALLRRFYKPSPDFDGFFRKFRPLDKELF